MNYKTSLLTLGLMLLTPALAGGAGAPVSPTAPAACKTVAQIVAGDPQLSTLHSALQTAGYMTMLGGGQGTLFAPTNAAFAKLPSDRLASIMNDTDLLDAVLAYHMVDRKLSAAQLGSLKSVAALDDQNLSVKASGKKITVSGANVVRADLMACNGVVHTIDTVLMPPRLPSVTAAPAPTAPVVTTPAPTAPKPTLAPVPAPAPNPAPVVTAPTYSPIPAIPALPLRGATISGSTTTTGTTVTTPAPAPVTTTTTSSSSLEANTLYDVLANDDRFSELRDLLSDTGLTETLMSGEYTVFAPTNDAFATLSEDQMAVLSSDPELLKRVLGYHVVSGKVAADARNPITLEGSALMLGQAQVDSTALTASNGTIYVIDHVLLPEGLVIDTTPTTDLSVSTTPTTTTVTAVTTTPSGTTTTGTVTATAYPLAVTLSRDARFSTLSSLIAAAGLTETLSGGSYTILAPTNEAFAKLSTGDLDALRANPDRLKALLLGHVIGSRLTDSSLSTSTTLKTAQGNELKLSTSDNVIRVGNATVLGSTEIGSSNGVIVPIDTVLTLP